MLGEFELTGTIDLGNEVDPREALMLVHVAAAADEVCVVAATGAVVATTGAVAVAVAVAVTVIVVG